MSCSAVLHQVALDEVDSAHPQSGGRLRVLDAMADDLQVAQVRIVDQGLELIAHGRLEGAGSVFAREFDEAQRQLVDQ